MLIFIIIVMLHLQGLQVRSSCWVCVPCLGHHHYHIEQKIIIIINISTISITMTIIVIIIILYIIVVNKYADDLWWMYEAKSVRFSNGYGGRGDMVGDGEDEEAACHRKI